MTEENNLTNQTIGQAVGAVVQAASQTPEIKEAGSNLARTANVVTKTLENAVLPLAALNYGIEKARTYFQNKFPGKIAERMQEIPEENIQAPKGSIAGPALQALAFSHEEEALESLYLSLITTAMDSRQSNNAHPGFVEVLKQLTSTEAIALPQVIQTTRRQTACVQIKKMTDQIQVVNGEKRVRGSFAIIATNLFDYRGPNGKVATFRTIAAMVDNWVRLGLIDVSFDKWLTNDELYKWVENHPELVELRRILEQDGPYLDVQRGLITPTAFGINFGAAVKLWQPKIQQNADPS